MNKFKNRAWCTDLNLENDIFHKEPHANRYRNKWLPIMKLYLSA